MVGVADAIEKSTGDIYLAGLWKSWLFSDLLWCSLRGSTRFRPPLAPSWSWASLNGPINWNHVDHAPLTTRPRLRCLVDILDVGTQGPRSHQSGTLTLRGDIRPMFLHTSDQYKFYEAFRSDSAEYGWTQSEKRFFGIKWHPDEKLGPNIFVWFLAVAVDDYVHCLGLLPTRRRPGECRRVGFANWSKQAWFLGSSSPGVGRDKVRLKDRQPWRSAAVDRLRNLVERTSKIKIFVLADKSEYIGFSEVKRIKITIV